MLSKRDSSSSGGISDHIEVLLTSRELERAKTLETAQSPGKPGKKWVHAFHADLPKRAKSVDELVDATVLARQPDQKHNPLEPAQSRQLPQNPQLLGHEWKFSIAHSRFKLPQTNPLGADGKSSSHQPQVTPPQPPTGVASLVLAGFGHLAVFLHFLVDSGLLLDHG